MNADRQISVDILVVFSEKDVCVGIWNGVQVENGEQTVFLIGCMDCGYLLFQNKRWKCDVSFFIVY